VQMSVFVVRAFVKMRRLLGDTRVLARQLADLEKNLKNGWMFMKLPLSGYCSGS
jgi:hypothetical protein